MDDDGPARKKPKAEASPPTVFTFGASHSAARVQLLSRHTVYDLCDILCQCTAVGDGEGADSHMWNVDWQGRCYESGEFECMSSLRASQTTLGDLALPLNANLLWTYDYGSPARVQITLLETSTLADGESEAQFPRKMVAMGPAGYAQYSPPQDLKVDLDETFAHLNKWAFVEGESVSLNLFQPPRTRNHGYLERCNMGVHHMIFMPAAPPKDLAAYLHCLDAGVSLGKPKMYRDDCPEYSWYSMVVLPAASVNERLRKTWFSDDQEVGFVEAKVVPDDANLASLNKAFPKIAALAGFAKDKKVPRGWLTHKDGILRICHGKSQPAPKSGAPKGTAFSGSRQHEPEDKASVLFTVDARAKSLHDLFCVAEGLLRCL